MKYLSNKDYAFIYNQVPRICVDLAFIKDGLVYMTKRDIEPYKELYHLPGGGVKFGESMQSAILRIAKHEVNTSVEIGKLLGFAEMRDEKVKGDKRHSISLVFQVKGTPENGMFLNVREENSSMFHPDHYNFLNQIL